jgi:hypothetical protein
MHGQLTEIVDVRVQAQAHVGGFLQVCRLCGRHQTDDGKYTTFCVYILDRAARAHPLLPDEDRWIALLC